MDSSFPLGTHILETGKKWRILPLVSSSRAEIFPMGLLDTNQHSFLDDNQDRINDILSSESLYRIIVAFCGRHSSSWLLKKNFWFFLLKCPNGDELYTCREESIDTQETYPVGLVFIHSPPDWHLLCRQHHIIMWRVQKGTSDVISLPYVFCMEIVDFFVGIYLRWLKTFCRVLKYRWKNFKFAHFGIFLKQKCYC